MGTADTLPLWAAEISYMEQFGWTEKELHEEVSLGMVRHIQTLNELRAKASKVRERQARIESKHTVGRR